MSGRTCEASRGISRRAAFGAADPEHFRFHGIAAMLYLLVFAQFRAENCCALFLELL